MSATRAEVCIAACTDIFRHAGEAVCSAFGVIPSIAARLARELYEPDLLISDGQAYMLRGNMSIEEPSSGDIEAYTPFRTIFDLLWHGRRYVMMIPSQVDRFGNTNISAIGDHAKPTVQLLGVRGAPGNSISHPTGYWVPKHSTRVFVESVDMVSGVGTDRAAAAGPAATRFQSLQPIVTDLGVLDYADDGRLRLASVHPGVAVADIVAATGFELVIDGDVPETRQPTDVEIQLIRDVIDPASRREREVPARP